MKKIIKSLLLLVAVTAGTGIFVSCSDDDDLTTADALFRPIINEDDNIEQGLDANTIPYMIVTWDNYTSANQYTVRVEAVDGSDKQEITTSETKCQFNNLKYDTEYYVYINSANTETGLSSKPYSITTTTLDYPTSLSSVATSDIIDTQVRIKWSGDDTVYDNLKIYKDSNDSLVCDTIISDDINALKQIIIKGLDPKTGYRVEAYKNNAYQGKKRFSTVASEKYSGAVFDLRGMDASTAKSYITTDQIATDVADNPDKDITYVLEGGTEYKISGGTKIPATTGTVKFVTGLTLAGNAKFIHSGGWSLNNGEEVNGLWLEKIDIRSDKFADDDALAANTAKGFEGRQVFNINGTKATLHNITFKSCTIGGFRAIVRCQADGDNVENVTFDDCVINGIGDQGVVTTNNKSVDMRSITFKNSTITNIVMLSDLRKTVGTLTYTVQNCTFCYAPMETTANANTPMFRLGTGNVALTVKNTLFGPSMATTESAGGDVHCFTPGVAGSIFVSGEFDNLVVENSYKTNFTWTDRGTDEPVINPLEGLIEAGMSETELWKKPTEADFSIIGKIPSGLGDARWQ